MNIFTRIKEKCKLNNLIKKHYIPFFLSFSQQLKRLNVCYDTIPCEIEEIYRKIKLHCIKKNKNKYAKLLQQFDNFCHLRDEHNTYLRIYEEMSKNFSVEDIIKKPTNIDKLFLSNAAELINKHQNFILDNKQRKILENLDYIYSNIEKILEQYFVYTYINDILEKLPDIYLDRNYITKYLAVYDKTLVDINNDKLHFYNFIVRDDFLKKLELHNANFIERHLGDTIFENIDNKSLDKEQRIAVLKDEISNMVIAGAGSGKTLTICGKIKYLLEVKGLQPEEILLLSYSRKSAHDLEKKIKCINSKINVGTFHKIGLKILEKYHCKKFSVEEQFDAIIDQYFREYIQNDRTALHNLIIFQNYYEYDFKDKHYQDEGELFTDLKRQNLVTLRDKIEHLTLKNERVKSIQELQIANFYFLNGINYYYEAPFREADLSTNDNRQYLPDFYLVDYGIYHEHYGVNEQFKATQYSEKENINYEKNMLWKRDVHNQYKTKYIETYSYQFKDGTILENLKEQLIRYNVKFKPLSDDEIHKIVNCIYSGINFKSFINLVKSFLSLFKSRYDDVSCFDLLKNSDFENKYEKIRSSLFLDICKDIYIYYKDKLKETGKIDFDDMILESKQVLNKLDSFKYKYIIVDEFQDISYSRMLFLKELIKHGNAKFLAVGDDWQAIYRFSGCDVSLFTQFEKYFGKSAISTITTTHRNSQQLQDVVGPFIKKNKEQINKTIQSNINLDKPIRIIYTTEDKKVAFNHILGEINNLNQNANILVLGRNNSDITMIDNETHRFILEKNSIYIHSVLYPKLKIRYSTVHASKGLEEDFVILINAEDKPLGFPNLIEEDPILNLVLSKKDIIDYAEERRLFYVALTRTKSYCYILTDVSCVSPFVHEISDSQNVLRLFYPSTLNSNLANETKDNQSAQYKCPRCKSGNLVKRVGTYGMFYGCSNFPYCRYTIDDEDAVYANRRCPICGDYLIKKKGKLFTYDICHNYKRCKYSDYSRKKYMHNILLKIGILPTSTHTKKKK